METRRTAANTRRRILDELGQLAGGDLLIQAATNNATSSPANTSRSSLGSRSLSTSNNNSLLNSTQEDFSNMSNILNNIVSNSSSGRKSSADEEVIRVRGRKKRKSAPILRDLSPATLVNIKSPMKRPTNEDIAYFLRSPTPKKPPQLALSDELNRKRARQGDSTLEAKMKRTRKSLNVELEAGLLSSDGNKSMEVKNANKEANEASTSSCSKEEPDTNEVRQSNNEARVKGNNKKMANGSDKKRLINSICRDSPRKNLRRSTNVAC